MAISERFATCYDELVEDFDDNRQSDVAYDSDDSESDPSYNILEETSAKLSRLSIKKKSEPSSGKVLDMEVTADADDVMPNDGNDENDTDEIIIAGKLDKLKVEQCKAYLRKNGLRLTGNKDTLIHRIKEHLEILNGGGEKKYPESSFILNCKGDACTGDVVMFEQNVYEMYNIASRSSIGPSCGTRIVAGRIVKESYGASKQQHTFTIEVLWSKGEKPLPPLHPLLIKGRNLYRLKTLRQSWKDEGERQKVIMEKHARGSLARSNREARVLEKEKRKILQENRILRKESNNSSQANLTSAGTILGDSRKVAVQHQQYHSQINSGKQLPPQLSENRTIQTNSVIFPDHQKWSMQHQNMDSSQSNYGRSQWSVQLQHMDSLGNNYRNQASRNAYDGRSSNTTGCMSQGVQPAQQSYNYKRSQQCRYYAQGRCHYGENCKFFHDRTENCQAGGKNDGLKRS